MGDQEEPSNRGSPPVTKDDAGRQSVLSRSAKGATFLIALQVGSRALTFIVNQVLLRYLSPELLGLSAQLELFSNSILFFSRESLRVALQRQSSDEEVVSGPQTAEKGVDGSQNGDTESTERRFARSSRMQEIINIAWMPIMIGPVLAYLIRWLQLKNTSSEVLETRYMKQSLNLYEYAALLELISEPCFAIAQQDLSFGIRAAAEGSATFARCIITCAAAIYGSRKGSEIGVLPFALGQWAYVVVLNLVYYGLSVKQSWTSGYSIYPRVPPDGGPKFYMGLYPKGIVSLAANLYGQSVLKHLLTQGDSILIMMFTTTAAQGAYALASNYGSLLARMLFQPIEESSRSVFSRFLSSSTDSFDSGSNPHETPDGKAKTSRSTSSSSRSGSQSAHDYLNRIMRLYAILSNFLVYLGPFLAQRALPIIAGSQWRETEAPTTLFMFCYYLPLLAFNGILEAFVSVVATPAQLRRQSVWMLGFSVVFAFATYLLLRVAEAGAKGVIVANMINMAMRVVWSWCFIRQYFDEKGLAFGLEVFSPGAGSTAGVVGLVVLGGMTSEWTRLEDAVKQLAVAAVCGIMILYSERKFLMECYRMLRPSKDVPERKKTQ